MSNVSSSFRVLSVLGVTGLVLGACVDPDSPLIEESAEGCDELRSIDRIEAADVDRSVKRLMLATHEFSELVEQAKGDVMDACAGVALDLDAEDTWSEIDDEDDAISNSEKTGACDQAADRIEALLPDEAEVDIALSISKGGCHVEYDKQIECDQECTTEEECEPGPAETRCEPGSLSVICEGSCSAEAVCMGSVEVAANCKGRCQAECVGHCSGSCIAADGTATEDDENCRGKCSASCEGECRGQCEIEASGGIECGADVRCRGGCESEFTDPVCTTEYGPPECEQNTVCQDVCTARLWAKPVCEPTTVEVLVDVDAHPELEPLKATLEEHLPRMVELAEDQGKRAQVSLERLLDASGELADRTEDLDGKSLACAGNSADAVADLASTIEVVVDACASITVMTKDGME